jgi:hypothetical protein
MCFPFTLGLAESRTDGALAGDDGFFAISSSLCFFLRIAKSFSDILTFGGGCGGGGGDGGRGCVVGAMDG